VTARDEASRQTTSKHHRPSAAELDERIAIPLDPVTVIEGMMQVDAEKVAEAMPKRDRPRRPT
jgi:hypothetical protein